jgi:hypothetical protein
MLPADECFYPRIECSSDFGTQQSHSLRRMEPMSSLAIDRVADQILVDAMPAKSRTTPADIASPIGFAPSTRLSR